jgi:Zn-finger nucleic acid-binding protein
LEGGFHLCPIAGTWDIRVVSPIHIAEADQTQFPACPRCREPVIMLDLEGGAIDRCAACDGAWLDVGDTLHSCF